MSKSNGAGVAHIGVNERRKTLASIKLARPVHDIHGREVTEFWEDEARWSFELRTTARLVGSGAGSSVIADPTGRVQQQQVIGQHTVVLMIMQFDIPKRIGLRIVVDGVSIERQPLVITAVEGDQIAFATPAEAARQATAEQAKEAS
jgi:hypothetical protein